MSSRRAASKAAKALEATAKLRELREGGKRSRLDEIDAEVDAIENVYDELDEEQYRALVQKRREAGGDFVVNDDGEGYEDLGEEEDWTEANPNYSDDDEYDADGRRVAKAVEEAPKRVKLDAKEKARRANAKAKDKAGLLAGGVAKKKKLDDVAEEADTDALLEDILAGVDVDVGAPAVAPRRVAPPAPVVRPAPAPVLRRSPRKAAAIVAATRVKTDSPTSAKKSVKFEMDAVVAEEEDLPTGDCGGFNDADDDQYVDAPVPMEEEPTPDAAEAAMDVDTAVVKPKHEQAPEKVSTLKTLDDEDLMLEESGPVTQDSAPVSFNGTELPQDADGSMPFFFMDAHEERESPGQVFLFGRVPVSNDANAQTVSACAVVQNMQRSMFVIPTPGTFDDPDGSLEELGQAMEETRRDFKFNPDNEEKKVKAADAKKALMKALIPKSASLREEIKEVLKARKIENFKISLVRRHYCFERKDIPRGPIFVLKVKTPGTTMAFPSDMKGKNYIAIMGTQAPMLELLTLKSKLKGPSWISLHGATVVPQDKQKSWCKLELALPLAHKGVRPQVHSMTLRRESPRLTVASLNLQTIINQQTNVNEIAVASVEYLRDVSCDGATTAVDLRKGLRHFTVVRKLDGLEMPPNWQQTVTHENSTNPIAKRTGSVVLASQTSELGLLNFLLAKLHQLDPDVIVGHNIGGFNLDVLLRRLQANKIGHWSRIGRMKRTRMPNINGTGGAYGGGASMGALQCVAGRLLADTYLSAKDILNKEVSYTLSSLSETQLGVRRLEVASTEIPNHYQDAHALMHLIKCTEQDAKLSLHLMFKMEVIPLTKQLSNIAGNMWSKTLGHTRAQRVEYLLLHEFHSRKYIVPDRLSSKERRRVASASGIDDDDGGKKGPSYAGGLVLEPKKGLYDTFVLVLDYQSLYPSIIQEYNICYTTVNRHFNEGEESTVELPQSVADDRDFAVLPSVIKKIVDSRKEVKGLMGRESDPGRKKQYDLRQLALKLTANSMYGCLGFSASRFFAEPIAALITSQGRNILQRTVDLARTKCELDVIYGDTDSIMVNTKSHDFVQARVLGNKLIRFVNMEYRKLVLEEDYVFKAMLLLKKKKYAALKVVPGPNNTKTTKLEMKGLDIVRRDWCPLVKELGTECLKELLECGEDIEDRVNTIHDELRKVRADMVANQINIEKYVITKQLTKSVDEYPDAKHQAHVMVAKRRLEAGKQDGVKAGETVPYIIALESDMSLEDIANGKAGSSGGKGLAERAFHPEEVIERGLKVDLHYYLSQQVHPVISRLCTPIEETDGAKMAECLGLDSNKFRAQLRAADDEFDDGYSGGSFALEDEERFKHCKPLELHAQDGSMFQFCGIRQVLDGKVAANAALAPPTPGADDKENAQMNSQTSGKVIVPSVSSASFANQVRLAVREHIKEYYAAPLRSDDDVDGSTTRNIALRVHHSDDNLTGTLNADPLSKGRMQKTIREEDLYNQLLYYKRLLSTEDALRSEKDKTTRNEKHMKIAGSALETAVNRAHDALNGIMDKCSYRWISLAELFYATKTSMATK